jgi:hypothetical protein
MQMAVSQETVVTLSNAAQLAATTIMGVVGNELSDCIAGSPVTQQTIFDLALAKFQSRLNPLIGAN